MQTNRSIMHRAGRNGRVNREPAWKSWLQGLSVKEILDQFVGLRMAFDPVDPEEQPLIPGFQVEGGITSLLFQGADLHSENRDQHSNEQGRSMAATALHDLWQSAVSFMADKFKNEILPLHVRWQNQGLAKKCPVLAEKIGMATRAFEATMAVEEMELSISSLKPRAETFAALRKVTLEVRKSFEQFLEDEQRAAEARAAEAVERKRLAESERRKKMVDGYRELLLGKKEKPQEIESL